jgi:HSP20 family protein
MLVRQDPFRRLDHMTDDLWRRLGGQVTMAMDVTRHDDGIEISMDVPGVRPDDIELSVERNVLTVRAERRPRHDDGEPITQERSVGVIVREVMLGDSLDAEGISASYEHGVLTIAVPSRPDASPRKIEIETGATTGAIDAPSSESGRRSKSTSRSKRKNDDGDE